MAYTKINSEDLLVQTTLADHLEQELGWEQVFAWSQESFGPDGTLGRSNTGEAVLKRDLRAALARLNPGLPNSAIEDALAQLTQHDFSRSLLQHNQAAYALIRDGVLVEFKDAEGRRREVRAKVIDFDNGSTAEGQPHNRFLAVRELKLTGLRSPHYNSRADLICFVNGLPLVFIECKAIHKNIRDGFTHNLTNYLNESIPHAFDHNAFLIVTNGHRARYGSITSSWEHFAEWKRNTEAEPGDVEAQVLFDGMLAKDRLLDLVENFILFDASKAGDTRKVIARNHQVLGVNRAMASVARQRELMAQHPPQQRLRMRELKLETLRAAEDSPEFSGENFLSSEIEQREQERSIRYLEVAERVHPDLGRLGVFWHTQGSGKSYSMAFLTEKIRRKLSSSYTFLVMTDRNDLDDQLFRTFVGCGIVGEKAPRASTGHQLKKLVQANHRYLFSLIHKFNQNVDPLEPYTTRDDIIVISDEAHRTQAGKLARNMRLALPNASFIGFTGTPLFKNDQLTRRIFGEYVSTYDFKRSEEDGSTVKLVYENRGEKLGIARLDLNDQVAEAVAKVALDESQQLRLDKLLGQSYEVITSPKRLDKVAADFVEHCSARWESGKALMVCIDKETCGQMYKRILPLWEAKTREVEAAAEREADDELRATLRAKAAWMEGTKMAIIVSEAQNEVAAFRKVGVNIIPHRQLMKEGFELPGGKTLDVESAFKNPDHPFRIGIVCAMWLTGFDVESLSTLYLDKPMKAHTLMQGIARANRKFPGKDFGLIVDYNGMLKALQEALAQYALGDEGGDQDGEIIAPLETRVAACLEAVEETEAHLLSLGFDVTCLMGAKGFARIKALADATDAVLGSRDQGRKKFEIMARQVFTRFKALVMEPAAQVFAERHDNIESIYRKLIEHRDNADIGDLLNELRRIVGEAVDAHSMGQDQAKAKTFDLSKVNLEKLKEEFAKAPRKAATLEDIRQVVEKKLEQMLGVNPERMDYYGKYSEIIADYNRDKDRVTIEETFSRLMDLSEQLSEEDKQAAKEGLTEDQYALFCLMRKEGLSKSERERLKQGSQALLDALLDLLPSLDNWTEKEETQAEVEVLIRDRLFTVLPSPPFTDEDQENIIQRIYQHIWDRSERGGFAEAI